MRITVRSRAIIAEGAPCLAATRRGAWVHGHALRCASRLNGAPVAGASVLAQARIAPFSVFTRMCDLPYANDTDVVSCILLDRFAVRISRWVRPSACRSDRP